MAHAKRRPMGYRFHPTNTEVLKYLSGFARDEPLPNQNELMQLVNLYADKEPWQIFEGSNTNTNTRYFITPQKKQNPRWKRFSRSVGKGTWKPQGKGKDTFDNKGRLMGYVKSLKYVPNADEKSSANGEWLMTEYSLYDGYLDAREIKNKGYVICKIKKKEKCADSKGVSEENMSEVEQFINSVLDIINEEEDVGDAVLGLMGDNDDDDVAVEADYNQQDININEEEDVGDAVLGLMGDNENVGDAVPGLMGDNDDDDVAVEADYNQQDSNINEEEDVGDAVLGLMGDNDDDDLAVEADYNQQGLEGNPLDCINLDDIEFLL